MKKLLLHRPLYVYVALGVIAVVIFMLFSLGQREQIELVTTTVERGTVERLVSVSGVVEAEQTAELAFPTSGIVSAVNVDEGIIVEQGDILITLESRALQADRADALASLARAVATRDELAAGADTNERAATAESVSLKETTLATTRTTQEEIVANARRALLSSDLTAISNDLNEEAPAPIVTGTYSCDTEGTYELDVYASNAESGYSYRLSGIESGTFNVAVDQNAPLGACGLRIQFITGFKYNNSQWTIEIPNTKSSQYVLNRNTYALAQTQAASAISIAEQDVVLAKANANNTNAPARVESIARANADIASANARVARTDSQIADRMLRAPFAGTITDIDILPGETANTEPVVTVLAQADFELTARIPEIDIGKLEIGQQIRAVFDARSDETLFGTIDFISLKATEIDGVAYYEAIITLEENPTWLRSGLNADIDIIITEAIDVLRVPNRFVTTENDSSSVVTQNGEIISTTTIDVLLRGDDGFTAIIGLNEGDTVVAP